MATFNGLQFDERGGGGGAGFAGRAQRAEIAQTAIPGGGVLLQKISSGGGVSAFSVPCQGTNAQLHALRGEVGAAGTLDFAGGSISARLQAISGAEQVVDGFDIWRWVLEFVG
jgi:hypothetical protein